MAGCTDIHSGSLQSFESWAEKFHFQGLESPSEMNNSAGVGNSLTSHVILKSQTFAGFENNSLDTFMLWLLRVCTLIVKRQYFGIDLNCD